jgi:hypothetical protein
VFFTELSDVVAYKPHVATTGTWGSSQTVFSNGLSAGVVDNRIFPPQVRGEVPKPCFSLGYLLLSPINRIRGALLPGGGGPRADVERYSREAGQNNIWGYCRLYRGNRQKTQYAGGYRGGARYIGQNRPNLQ